jgi:aryl-alcohol dehydrogenase-like predicted oxidoreductase
MQNHYNLLYREEEREMLPLCREMGIAITPWSPLARGLLAGSRKKQTVRATTDQQAHRWYGHHAEDSIVAAVEQVATHRGVPPAQVALAWITSRQEITSTIIGATKPHHLGDAIAGLALALTDDEIATLETPYQTRPVAEYE